jgi:hypothetical protein
LIDREASSARSVLSSDGPSPPIPCDETSNGDDDGDDEDDEDEEDEDDDRPQITVTLALPANNFLCLALIPNASSMPAAPRPTT